MEQDVDESEEDDCDCCLPPHLLGGLVGVCARVFEEDD